jgi:hypothetical protein
VKQQSASLLCAAARQGFKRVKASGCSRTLLLRKLKLKELAWRDCVKKPGGDGGELPLFRHPKKEADATSQTHEGVHRLIDSSTWVRLFS